MYVGEALLDLARAGMARTLYVVGTGKNVGKTVAMRAIAGAAARRGLVLGLTSTGRDGEAVDAADASAKPRLFLHPGTIVATARALLPAHPASEILGLSGRRSASGEVLFARVRHAAYYELAGPPTAAGVRACVERLQAFGCEQVIVDGAIDRIAALAGGGAVIVAVGAAAARTQEEATDDVCALVARLRLPAYDPSRPFLRVEGALTPALASQLAQHDGSPQIVVRDATRIAASGKALLGIMRRLQVRCEHALDVVAVTVASAGAQRSFEPRAFAQAVAQATGLPAFDVYAGTMVSAA